MGLTSHDLSYDAYMCPPVTGNVLRLGPLIFPTVSLGTLGPYLIGRTVCVGLESRALLCELSLR